MTKILICLLCIGISIFSFSVFKKTENPLSVFSFQERVVENPPISLNKTLLSVPQFVQENGYFCVPACLQMVLAFHGITQRQSILALQMNTSSITGTEYVDLAQVVNQYLFNCTVPTDSQGGYRIQKFSSSASTMTEEEKNLFQQRVFQDISTQDPVFVAINRNVLYPELSPANHMVIVVGYATYEGSNRLAYYYIIDPSYQVQDPVYGGLKVITQEELIKGIMLNESNEKAYIW